MFREFRLFFAVGGCFLFVGGASAEDRYPKYEAMLDDLFGDQLTVSKLDTVGISDSSQWDSITGNGLTVLNPPKGSSRRASIAIQKDETQKVIASMTRLEADKNGVTAAFVARVTPLNGIEAVTSCENPKDQSATVCLTVNEKLCRTIQSLAIPDLKALKERLREGNQESGIFFQAYLRNKEDINADEKKNLALVAKANEFATNKFKLNGYSPSQPISVTETRQKVLEERLEVKAGGSASVILALCQEAYPWIEDFPPGHARGTEAVPGANH